jgi:outer membrane protein
MKTLSIAAVTMFLGATLSAVRLQAQGPGPVSPPPVVTIEQAVDIATERNLSLTLGRTDVETAGARMTSAFGAFLPRLTVSSNYNKPLTDGTSFVNGIPIVGNQPSYTLQASVGASLLLFDGFSRTAGYNSAQSSFNASIQALNRSRQDVAYQTRAAFLDALRAEQMIEVRRNDLDLAREQLARGKGLVEAGVAQPYTVYTQESEVANAELALEVATTDATVARNRLSLLLNYDPTVHLNLSSEGLVQSLDSTELRATRAQLGPVANLFEKQLQSRPDIRAAQMKIDAAAASVTVARAGYYPSLTTSLGWGWQTSALSGGDIRSNSAQFGLNLEYTAFDGFRTGEQVELAEAQRQTAEIELRRLQLQARSDLEGSLAQLDGAERELRASEKAVLAARQSRYAANERYRLGAGNYSDYLLANSQYLTAQLNQVNSVFKYRLALYQVRYYLGDQ